MSEQKLVTNIIYGLRLSEYAKASNAKIVISGGYLSSFSPPVALGLD
jgi:hypothetical protein